MNQYNSGLILAALLLIVACLTEPKQTQAVTSRSDAGTSIAPPAKEVAQRDNALVRVINAVPGVTSFDVFANDQKVFEKVSFKSLTPYTELSAALHTFRVNQPGQDSAQPVAERRGIELRAERLEKNTSIWSFLTLLFFAAVILLGFFLVKDYLKDYRVKDYLVKDYLVKDYRVKDYRRRGRPHHSLGA